MIRTTRGRPEGEPRPWALAAAALTITVGLPPALGAFAAPPPSPRTVYRSVAFASLTVLDQPNLARRVMAGRMLKPEDAGADVGLECLLVDGYQRLACHGAEAGQSPERVEAAILLSEGYRVLVPPEITAPDPAPNTRLTLTARLTVHVGPAPVVDLDRGDIEPLPATAVTLAERPSAFASQRNYPDRALRMRISGGVSLDCLVLADLSFACTEVVDETPPGIGFAAAGRRLGLYLRSAPTLKDGRPAAGQWVKMAFRFQSVLE